MKRFHYILAVGQASRESGRGLPQSKTPREQSASWVKGFSLIEVMVAVALLSVIIIGLVQMFSLTRHAFTSSITQVDVLDSGRSTADFIAREMEQMTPYGDGSGVIPNLYIDMPPSISKINQFIWTLGPSGDSRTNNMQEVFFLTRNNQQWNMIGYKIFSSPAVDNAVVGSLYRFYDSFTITNPQGDATALRNKLLAAYQAFVLPRNGVPGTNFTHLVDGVADFRVRPFTTNGLPILSSSPGNYVLNSLRLMPGEYIYLFKGFSVPASVEVELGVVEDRTLAHYSALTNGSPSGEALGLGYMTNHAAQLHIFRQRVTLQNVNPAAL